MAGNGVLNGRGQRHARPLAARRAGVGVPELAGDEVDPTVAVHVEGKDERRPPRTGRVDQVALPRPLSDGAVAGRRAARVQPNVQPGRLPTERLAQDVQVAVAVQIGQARLVMPKTVGRHPDLEATLPVAVEDPRLRVRVVAFIRFVKGHLAHEDVQRSVAVNVAQLQRMCEEHFLAQQIVGRPTGAVPLVPARHPGGVAGGDDYLRPPAGLQLADGHARVGRGGNRVGAIAVPAQMAQPVAAGNDVRAAVAVNVALGQPLISSARGGEDGPRSRPRLSSPGGGRNLDDVEPRRPLVPIDELDSSVAVKLTEHHVVVLALPAILDRSARPPVLIVGRRRVLPPPDGVALAIGSQHQVEIAVLINVVERAARLQR